MTRESADRLYTASDLAKKAGLNRRSIYYYISLGLLPPSEAERPGGGYGRQHLDRLRLIRELQRQHLPLADIRQRLEQLAGDDVARQAATGEPEAILAPYAESRGTRSHWERIRLSPDVEIHVRRPLGKFQRGAVDRLVALAQQVLQEEGEQRAAPERH